MDLLGCHALAIHQAGASIKRGICDLGDYQTKFEGQRQRLLKIRPKQAGSRYGDVYSTFEVTATYLSDLSERKDQTATDALGLLNFYAFMTFTNFPEKAFEEAWRNSRTLRHNVEPDTEEQISELSPWHRSHLPSFMRQCSSEEFDTISLRKAQSLLAFLSIVVLDLPAHATSMHPVTHMWARDRLEKQENRAYARLGALAVLCCSIKDPFEQDALWVQLQPHIELIKKPSPDDYLCSNEFHLHQSFYRLSWVLHELRADKAVIEMLQTCFIKADQSWTKFTYCEDIGNLYGSCLLFCGDVKEATKILEYVVKIQRRLARDHPKRLSAQHDLASAYRVDGQIDKAIKLLKHIVEIREKLAEDHHDRLNSQNELALTYQANGQTDKTVKLLKQIVKIQENLIEDHPDRLASQHGLAPAYLTNGQMNEAIKLFEHVVQIHKKKLAEDHPSLLTSQYEMAIAYQINGQLDDAIKLLEHVVKIRKEKLAEDHYDRLYSQQELAVAYRENKQIEEAIELFEHIVKIEYEKLAENHPLRLLSHRNLAIAYRANGQINKAIKLLEHVVQVYRKNTGRRSLLSTCLAAFARRGVSSKWTR